MSVVVTQPVAAAPGSLLVDRYFVETVLGQGSYGRVLRALDMATGRTVALKEFERDKGQSGRFFQELGVVFDLRHPNVVAAESLVMAGRHRYLVCEYMEGGSLRDAILDRRMRPSELAMLVAAVARGVGYAHGRGIVHRDLKPENVLLSRREGTVHAKVSDFGIAALVGTADARASVGSPAYMAPEQFSEGYDERIDQYALGVMLFEVVCGTRPFHGTPSELFAMHLRRDVEVFDWVPRMLTRVVRRALAKRPDRRFATAIHFADALQLALLHEGEAIDRESVTHVAGVTRVVSVTGRSLVVAADRVVLVDDRGRVLGTLRGADEVVGTQDTWALKRGSEVHVDGPQGSRTVRGAPSRARIAVSSRGALAFEHDGAVVAVDPSGRFETVVAEGASSPCFVGDEQLLAWFEGGANGSILRLGNARIPIAGTPRDVCACPNRLEVVFREASRPDRVVLVRLGDIVAIDLACGEVTTDGRTFYAATSGGELASINAMSGKVARTRLEEPVAVVGAGPTAIVGVAEGGRVYHFS